MNLTIWNVNCIEFYKEARRFFMRKKKLIINILILISLNLFLFADDFMELYRRAADLRAEGKYKETAEMYENYIAENGPDALNYYSTACSWALEGNKDAAFKNLSLSIDNGMLELEWLKTDEDFESIRNDKRFEEIIAQLEHKITELENNLPKKHNEKIIIELPEPRLDSEISIEETLQKRRSIRKYSDDPLTMEEVSQILWAAYGITKPYPDGPAFLRGGLKTAPSAGATYPLEIYLVAGNVIELSAGIYKYKPEDHSIFKISDGDVRKELAKAALEQPWVLKAPASIVYSAVFSRTTDFYGDRGRERYVCMDLGHSAENVYLQAVALDMGTVAIGAFSDIKVKLLINMTREEEPIYIMPLGKLE